MRVFSGKELLDLLGRITSNSEIIEINRSQSRNNNAKFSSIQVCSRITNGAIGFAIGHKINQIICVNRFLDTGSVLSAVLYRLHCHVCKICVN